ncbi:hypothetical protein E2C01_031652 [Portunus trituberculatus]|uniref:Uncharacterized protein n=1 Tax=Portunus trituberculatus TaxID=210409 RepID=A0A5B7EYP6_PORTR|nr:hypothetical protein [Portunus trituberculatus]
MERRSGGAGTRADLSSLQAVDTNEPRTQTRDKCYEMRCPVYIENLAGEREMLCLIYATTCCCCRHYCWRGYLWVAVTAMVRSGSVTLFGPTPQPLSPLSLSERVSTNVVNIITTTTTTTTIATANTTTTTTTATSVAPLWMRCVFFLFVIYFPPVLFLAQSKYTITFIRITINTQAYHHFTIFEHCHQYKHTIRHSSAPRLPFPLMRSPQPPPPPPPPPPLPPPRPSN